MQALHRLAEEFERVHGFVVEIASGDLPDLPSDEARGELFLLLQEAIRNARRHSGGNRFTLNPQRDRIGLLDNGQGLRTSWNQGNGLGCASMQERAARLGWRMELAPEPENGWFLFPGKNRESTHGR
jgi:signal transduction histidine kinase